MSKGLHHGEVDRPSLSWLKVRKAMVLKDNALDTKRIYTTTSECNMPV